MNWRALTRQFFMWLSTRTERNMMFPLKHYPYILVTLGVLLTAPASYADPADTSFSRNGNAETGRRVFNRCKACHNLTASSRTRLGPNLDALFGRKAGSALDYKYSRALKEADFVWTEANLDDWLKRPNAFLPGNKMQFAGVRAEQDRMDLIAYLRQATISSK